MESLWRDTNGRIALAKTVANLAKTAADVDRRLTAAVSDVDRPRSASTTASAQSRPIVVVAGRMVPARRQDLESFPRTPTGRASHGSFVTPAVPRLVSDRSRSDPS